MNTTTDILDKTLIKNKRIHIIGCGATGSHLAVELVKLGCEKLILWDFDIVEEHNLTNQIWTVHDIGKSKTDALKEHLLAIVPDLQIITKGKWDNQPLTGTIFNCVDSMELRKRIYEENIYNDNIDFMFDPRLGSRTGSVFTYKWNVENAKKLINFSDFKDDEIDVEVSLCGTKININTTLFEVVNNLLINFINVMNKQPYYERIYFEPLKYNTSYWEYKED